MTTGNDRSVQAGRDIMGSLITTGDGNMVQMRDVSVTLTSGDDVDIGAELAGLRQALMALQASDQGKIDRALQDAEEEARKAEPDKDEIGSAVERAVKYAKGASDFGENVGKIADQLAPVVSWLGNNWTGILSIAGIAF
ncbi:hypothetical protein ACTTAL_10470 [Rhodobacter capsulatus]|uniref:hypothetical protein n=1 Tax=Rhodobacter capsulatus TaxID=1061 RepID=UPI0003D2D9E1|nr:hypothetical protein [Rhodobacter capsulatus]ETD90668.1 hypothetical protein U713_04785 [Rhodobacter capsulatus YW2]